MRNLLDVDDLDRDSRACLPARRGEEITDAVIEGARRVVWRQPAHRRTAVPGMLAWVTEAAGEAR